jgi:hypothetical protein
MKANLSKCPKCGAIMSIKTAYCITDYKTFGSYKVAKCLGLKPCERDLRDNEGNVVLLKSGKNKGKPKKIKTFLRTGEPDLKNETLQLNQYRILFEAAGFHVSRMRLQIIVRDGGLYIAKSRGVDKNMYIVEIPYMKNSDVVCYYAKLQADVDAAFATGYAPRCSDEESWDGKRCSGYCDVAHECMAMGLEGSNDKRIVNG